MESGLADKYKVQDENISKVIQWIERNEYKKICLQFPDELLEQSVDIALQLQKCTGKEIFVLGDTSYGSCCVDVVAAKHVDADAIVHFGNACLTPFEGIPTYYSLPKKQLDVSAFVNTITEFLKINDAFLIILYDVVYHHCVDEILDKLTTVKDKIIMSRLSFNRNHSITSTNVKENGNEITKFGRSYSLPSDNCRLIYVYIADSSSTRNMDNFVMSSDCDEFYSYKDLALSGGECCLTRETVSFTIKRRLYLIEKVRDAKAIGILAGTLAITDFFLALQRVKRLCRRHGKKTYVISLGKPTVAKLANFPEIDVFVMIACPETHISNKSEYFQPIVSMMEVELALNEKQTWKNKASNDFHDFLPGGTDFIEVEENSVNVEDNMSLLTNSLRLDENSTDLLAKEPLEIVPSGNVKDGLSGRTWQGLEYNIGGPIEKTKIGLTGNPTAGYKYPESDNLI